ncbi:MAG: hypothetical protein ABI847_12505, partial [Anaerolineales bacterium]
MPIIFNGETYKRVEDMPAETRQAYERAIGMLANNDPAAQPAAGQWSAASTPNTFGTSEFMVNGQAVNGLDSLPPETRQKIEQAMAMLDKDHNGIMDFMEKMPGLAQYVMNGQMMKGLETLPPEKREALQAMFGQMGANPGGLPSFGAAGPSAPSMPMMSAGMGAGMPAPLTEPPPLAEPPMLAMAPQIPMPAQPSAMAPMVKNVVDDPDAGRRRLVLVLVALLV